MKVQGEHECCHLQFLQKSSGKWHSMAYLIEFSFLSFNLSVFNHYISSNLSQNLLDRLKQTFKCLKSVQNHSSDESEIRCQNRPLPDRLLFCLLHLIKSLHRVCLCVVNKFLPFHDILDFGSASVPKTKNNVIWG